MVLALAGLIMLLGVSPARAQVTPSTASTAVVVVDVGGDRDSSGGVSRLPGVVLGLFPSPGGATEITRCTSDADGNCNLVVPDTGAGGANRGARFWVRQLATPAGWSAHPQLETGGTSVAVTDYGFWTPALIGGQIYRSGYDVMNDPGGSAATSSGGTWPSSRANPALRSGCGLDVALVIDLSAAAADQLSALRALTRTVAEALVGTRSRLGLYTFAAGSPAAGGTNSADLAPVSTLASASALTAQTTGWTAGGPSNWDQGLAAAARASEPADLAVVVTAGGPTTRGRPAAGPGGATRFAELEAAIFSANLLKSRGARVLAVGVGAAADLPRDLSAIAGPVGLDPANPDLAQTDVARFSGYAQAGAALRDLLLARCVGSVSVTHQIVPADTVGEDVTGAVPAGPGWEMEATGSTGVNPDPPTQRATGDDLTGTVEFGLTFAGTSPGPLTLVTTPQPGYSRVSVGGRNATCLDLASGAAVPVTNAGAAGFAVEAAPDAALACTTNARAPVPQTGLRVDQRWVVNGVAYAEGEQPADFRAGLELSGPADSPATAAGWGVTRPGYSVGEEATIDQTVELPPGGLCTLDASSVASVDTPTAQALPYVATLAAGQNEYVITTTVTCRARLTLLKTVRNGAAEPGEWTLTATGPNGGLPGPTGTSGIGADVTPEVAYALSESGGDPVYEQRDLDDDPTARSWRCVATSADGTELLGYAGGVDGRVAVALGRRVSCTAQNQTAALAMRVLVESRYGGTAEPGDWTLTATPVDPPAGVTAQSLPGSATGQTLAVRPGTTYRVTATGPDGYSGQVECVIATANPADAPGATDGAVEVPALETGLCTLTARDVPARLTLVAQVSDGPRDPAQWRLRADGPTVVSGASGTPGVTRAAVAPGRYLLSQNGPADYVASAWVCRGGARPPVTTVEALELSGGDEVTCTVTFRLAAPGPTPTPSVSPSSGPDAGVSEAPQALPATGGPGPWSAVVGIGLVLAAAGLLIARSTQARV